MDNLVVRNRVLTASARVCVLGASLARHLFGYEDAIGQFLRVGTEYFSVVDVIADRDTPSTIGALAWRDIGTSVIAPFFAISGRDRKLVRDQHVDDVDVALQFLTESLLRLFERVSASSIVLRIDGQLREIPESDVSQVERRVDHLWTDALIGAVLGAVGGARSTENTRGANPVGGALFEAMPFMAFGVDWQ